MEKPKTKSSLADNLTNLVRKLRIEIEDLQVEVATHKDSCKILSEDIEKKKQKIKQNEVEMIDDRIRFENVEKIHLNQKQNLKSLSDAELLLRTQLRSKGEEYESTIQRISAVKHRCEGVLKEYQKKLENRLEYYKTLPYVVEHDERQIVLQDLEKEILSRTKEVEDVKSEMAEICLNNDCDYGTVMDWGVAFAKRMLEIRDAKKENEARMKSIKDMTAQVEELRRHKSDIMRQQQTEKEKELIAQSKLTRVSSLMDISSLTKSSSKFSKASFETPLNMFDNFLNKTPKPVSLKPKTAKPTNNPTTAEWNHGSSGGFKMTGSLPDLCSIFSSFKSQLTKATTDFSFPDSQGGNHKPQRTLPKIPDFNFISPLPPLPLLFSENNEDVQKRNSSTLAVNDLVEDNISTFVDSTTEVITKNAAAEAVEDMVVDKQPTPSENIVHDRINTNNHVGDEILNIMQQEAVEEQRQEEMMTLPQQQVGYQQQQQQLQRQDGNCATLLQDAMQEQLQVEHTSVQQQHVDPTMTTTSVQEENVDGGVQQKQQDECTTLQQHQEHIPAQQHQDEAEVMQDENESEHFPLPPPPSQTSTTTTAVEEVMEVDAENVDDFTQQAEQQQQIQRQQFNQMETEAGEAEAAENNRKKMNISDVSMDQQYTERDDHQFLYPSTPDNRNKPSFPSTMTTPEMPDCMVAYRRMMDCGNGGGKTHDDSFDLDTNMLNSGEERATNFPPQQSDGANHGNGGESEANTVKFKPPPTNKQVEFAVPSHPSTTNKTRPTSAEAGEASNAIFSSLFCNNSQDDTNEGGATDMGLNKSSGSGFDFNFKSPISPAEKNDSGGGGFSFFFSSNNDAEPAQGPSATEDSFKITNLFASDENNDEEADNEESFSIFEKMF